MQSTESGGVVNFSVCDALTVNGVQVYHADGAYDANNGSVLTHFLLKLTMRLQA